MKAETKITQKNQWPFQPILLLIKIWWEWLYFSPCCWSGMLLMMSESPGNTRERHYIQNNAFIYNAQNISVHSDNLDFYFWNSAKHTSNFLNLHWHKLPISPKVTIRYNRESYRQTKLLDQVVSVLPVNTHQGQWWPTCTPCSICHRLYRAQCCFRCNDGLRFWPT